MSATVFSWATNIRKEALQFIVVARYSFKELVGRDHILGTMINYTMTLCTLYSMTMCAPIINVV